MIGSGKSFVFVKTFKTRIVEPNQRIKQMQEQLQMVEQQTMEAMATMQSIDEYSKLKDGDQILIPVNNGIFGCFLWKYACED